MSSSVNFTAPSLYPSVAATSLRQYYIGKQISDVPAPAAIIDAAVVRRNCELMLETAEKLGVGFRAHVKTHKTTELTELQVGKDSKSVKLVASTVSEVEHLAPWLQECKSQGKAISILYGIPVAPSFIPRLAAIARSLGEGSVGLFVDHPSHVKLLEDIDEATWPGKIPVHVNIDVGYHREGVAANSAQLADIAYSLSAAKRTILGGLYTHMGHSYAVSSPGEALKHMSLELEGLVEGALSFLKCTGAEGSQDPNAAKVVLSLGATPTATSIQNLVEDTDGAKQYRATIDKIKQSFAVEFHAGVYPVMDMQQLATRARPQQSAADPKKSLLSYADLAFRVLVEVASIYPDRGDKPEALIAAGSIVLGRDVCKSYPGWGVISDWPVKSGVHYDPEGSKTGWIVGRVSQEHGVLTWEGPQDNVRKLEIGDKLLVWPNHACIAGANFGWYLVVDSEKSDGEKIEDVWVRWRGW
ncbi:related to alanine racemase [Ramularia collo-cygni]|uniref:D-serine dehydratase n=1 Tax=Ramularia collo-cygni TaxID=112498 RepID=A0A2D3UZL4_9PEZI|nr:related to alanine racemase [Ramularia collo-cygni]CZT18670.1 related to alanine racemase [Ramularia collo-cygni]